MSRWMDLGRPTHGRHQGGRHGPAKGRKGNGGHVARTDHRAWPCASGRQPAEADGGRRRSEPTAIDDSVVVAPGASATIEMLTNDTGSIDRSTLRVTRQPTFGYRDPVERPSAVRRTCRPGRNRELRVRGVRRPRRPRQRRRPPRPATPVAVDPREAPPLLRPWARRRPAALRSGHGIGAGGSGAGGGWGVGADLR